MIHVLAEAVLNIRNAVARTHNFVNNRVALSVNPDGFTLYFFAKKEEKICKKIIQTKWHL